MICPVCNNKLSLGGGCPRCGADYGGVNVELLRAVNKFERSGTEMLAMRMIEADPHTHGTRPCQTCRAISRLLNHPFGCEKKRREVMTKLMPIKDPDTDQGEIPDIDTSEPGFWDDLKAIYNGLGLIDYEQFKAIIRATINCGDDYAAAKWGEFHGDRLNYCLSRSPEKQGYALVNLAVQQLAKIKAKERP